MCLQVLPVERIPQKVEGRNRRGDAMDEIDKTIRPVFSSPGERTGVMHRVDETVGPQKALTFHDLINPEAPEETASFLIYHKGKAERVEISKEESIIHIGKSRRNEIQIDEPSISDIQVAIIKMGDFMYFMDCGTNDLVTFNGVKRRQAVGDPHSRMVMKIANTWIIYGDSYKEGLSAEQPEAEFLLKSEQGECYSDNGPLLIGSHPACDLVVSDQLVQPFHSIVYFSNRGLFIEDLTHGKPGIKLNGMNSIGARPVTEDSAIAIGKRTVYLYVYGNIKEHCNILFQGFEATPTMAFTNLRMDLPPVAIPRTNERLSIGRGSTCNIIIPDPSVSRVHAHVLIKEKCLYLADNNSHNKTYVNRRQVAKTTVKPGDIVEFGDTPFLIHFAL